MKKNAIAIVSGMTVAATSVLRIEPKKNHMTATESNVPMRMASRKLATESSTSVAWFQ